MKLFTASAAAIALTMAIAVPGFAQSSQPPSSHHTHHTQTDSSNATDIPDAAINIVKQVDAFGQALARADFERVKSLLAPDAIILESGGVERSRDEYLNHHAKSDASFLADAHVSIVFRTARVDGKLAWLATESEIHTSRGNKPLTLLSTETMILAKRSHDWQIVHIHWSSRPKKTNEKSHEL